MDVLTLISSIFNDSVDLEALIILPALKSISDTIDNNPLEKLAAYTRSIESDDEIMKLDF